MSTVPVFAPDGSLGDIPQGQLMAAIKAGGKPGVTVKAPDGALGVVPSDRIQDAVKAGGSIVPLGEQDTQHPGFWQAVGDDLKGVAKGLATTVVNGMTGNELIPDSIREAAGIGPARDIIGQGQQMRADWERRKAAGYSTPYRVAAPVAEAAGANVTGMEDAAAQGDTAGVAGHAAVPIATTLATAGLAKGAPAIADAAEAAKTGIKTGIKAAGEAASAVGSSLDPDVVGLISPRAAHALRMAQKIGKVASKVDTTVPESPASQVLTDRIAAERQMASQPGFPNRAEGLPEVEAAQPQATAYLQKAVEPNQTGNVAAELPRPVAEPESQSATTEPTPPSGRALSGESALRQILTGQDNANLTKIAKSRGINITKESQLKPGVADNLIINKIMDDFAPDELDEIGARYQESTRFRHDFQDIGPEAWKTMSLQTYFPDIKLSQAAVNRTHAAILKAAANRLEAAPAEEDLTGILEQSVKQAQQRKALPSQ